MPLFSSSQPSMRVRMLPRFPARVVAGNGLTITRDHGVYTFAVNALDLSGLINAPNDAAASSLGVQIGKPYRNGSVLMVRVT